jgi:hypothetical protein
MDENEKIKQVQANHPIWVHAGNLDAYDAFSAGKVIFDVSPNAGILQVSGGQRFGVWHFYHDRQQGWISLVDGRANSGLLYLQPAPTSKILRTGATVEI